MEKETEGRVISVKKQWWLKINTKPVRTDSFDGAVFPHIIKVVYTVNRQEYEKKKWVRASLTPPPVGSAVRVVYDEEKPARAKIII